MIEPLKKGDPVAFNWRKLNEVVADVNGFRMPNQGRDEAISRTRNRLIDLYSSPFFIYQGSTWLKAKVTSGFIITTGDPFVPTNADTDLDLTSGVEFNWIYLDLTSTTAVFATTTITPTWSVNKLPIGWVDTTDTEGQNPLIKPCNLFVPCA